MAQSSYVLITRHKKEMNYEQKWNNLRKNEFTWI